jgi:hypothetical protein
MPSICLATFSSSDSANLSLESQSDLNDNKHRPKSFIEQQTSFTSDHLKNPQSSFKTNQTFQDDIYRKNKPHSRQKRFSSADLLDTHQIQERLKHNQRSMDNILVEQRPKKGNILFECLIMKYQT